MATLAQTQGRSSDYQKVPGSTLRVPNSASAQQGVVLTTLVVPTPSLSNDIDSVLSEPDSDEPRKILWLTIGNVAMPGNPTAFLRVFTNHKKPSLDVSEDDPHYLQDVFFFCCQPQGAMTMSFLLEVHRHLKGLKAKGENPHKGFKLQLLAGAIQGPAPQITPAFFELAVASQ